MSRLAFSNSDALVAADNGHCALNGSNAIVVAARGLEEDGFFLDMATSEVAYSRVMHLFVKGEREARKAWNPLGGFKGQGLGTMVQILYAMLANITGYAELTHLYDPPSDKRRQITHCMIAMAIGAFVDVARLRNRVSELLRTFRESPALEERGVLVAGHAESGARTRRIREGFPLSETERTLLQPFLRDESNQLATSSR
jgi:ureidoglycolate dehydrogenase (NAD+)